MNEDQISWLAGQSRQGLAYWMNADNRMLKIKKVSSKPLDLDGDGIAVPVALLEGGTHLDLINTDTADLFICQPMFR